MPEYTITTAQLPAAMQFEIKTNLGLTVQALVDTAHEARGIVAAASPVDTGRFAAAWTVRPIPYGADLRNDAPYAAVIEEGARPHWPPKEPIRAWVIRNMAKIGEANIAAGMAAPLTTASGKPRNPRKKRGGEEGELVENDNKVVERIVYLIRKDIATNGSPPHHILKSRQELFRKMMIANIRTRLNSRG